MKTGRKFALALAVAALAVGSAGAAQIQIVPAGEGEVFNCFEPLPPESMTGGATSFTIIFAGNVISEIDTSSTQSDAGLNPFLYLNNELNNGGTTTVGAVLDGNGNTDVTLSGSNAIMYNSSFDFNGLPHVGLASSGTDGTLDLISQTWSNGTSSYTVPGGISAYIAGGGGGGPAALDPYAILFADVTSGGNTVGQWIELPYTGSYPTLTITNYTGSAETLSNVGYFLSPTMIPLDNLNFGTTPPPGSLDSPFIPLPNLDGETLAGGDGIGGAGGSVTQGLPEPSSIISMGTGLLLFVAGYFGRRRIATRLGRTATSA